MLRDVIHTMKHSPRHNYVIPGLTSWLIGRAGSYDDKGCVRLFTMSREHEEPICPHSHRFDFTCIVLNGAVKNRIWFEDDDAGDDYQLSDVTYEGVMGLHQRTPVVQKRYSYRECQFKKGEQYWMKASQIHSIFFSKGAEVLFFEGAAKGSDISQVLEPVVNGKVIPLFKTEPWMFLTK